MADLSGVLGGKFDANEVEPTGTFEAIPAGEYEVAIVDSEMRKTSKGDGEDLNLELEVLKGPHANRKLWDKLNLYNPSEKAVQIARGTLSAICRAVGVMTPQDSSELYGRPLLAVVGVYEYQGRLRNEIRGYKPLVKAPEKTWPVKTSPNAVKREETDDSDVPF